MKGRGQFPIGRSKQNKANGNTHGTKVFRTGKDLVMDKGGNDHGRDEFTGPKDDFGGEVDVIQCQIGQAGTAQQAKGQEWIRRQGCYTAGFPCHEMPFEKRADGDAVKKIRKRALPQSARDQDRAL